MISLELQTQIDQLKTVGLVPGAANNITTWLDDAEYSEFHDSLQKLLISQEINELNDAFYKTIPFGTGGIRGKMGIGTNRINNRTIAQAVEGYVQYLKEVYSDNALQERGVVITYDVRHHSREFAERAAGVFTANGCKVHFFEGVRSTPQISFTIRHLGALGGAMISASHNPPSDNGIKLYWANGGQLVPPHDSQVIAKAEAAHTINSLSFTAGLSKDMIQIASSEIDEAYYQAVGDLSLGNYRDVGIVFTPLHGCASTSFLPVLRRMGFEHITEVAEQMPFDPEFSAVTGGYPNPEVPIVLDKAIALAKQSGADIVLAADPDADRIGVASRETMQTNSYIFLNGNQIGVLLIDYITRRLKELNTLPARGVVIKTIVTSELITAIAAAHGLEVIGDVPVGIKYIADTIDNRLVGKTFLFGGEESHGYIYGNYAREKDGAMGGLLLAEYAALLKERGVTLYQRLEQIKKEYGYFRELQQSLFFPGMDGMEKMARIMEEFRNNLPSEINNRAVLTVLDQQTKKIIHPKTGAIIAEYQGFSDNTLVFYFDDKNLRRIVVRPSGTEPKIKFYVAIGKSVGLEKNDAEYQVIKQRCDAEAYQMVEAFVALAEKISVGGIRSDILG